MAINYNNNNDAGKIGLHNYTRTSWTSTSLLKFNGRYLLTVMRGGKCNFKQFKLTLLPSFTVTIKLYLTTTKSHQRHTNKQKTDHEQFTL